LSQTLGRRPGRPWPAARRARSGGEVVKRLSHDDARRIVDDEVRGARDDLGVEGVDVALHAVDELRAHVRVVGAKEDQRGRAQPPAPIVW
jgi:hypothetical protein